MANIVEMENGVYLQPIKSDTVILLWFLLFVTMACISEKSSRVQILMCGLFFSAIVFMRLLYYKKHGKLGKPCIAIADDILVMDLLDDVNHEVRFELADLREILIYGDPGYRRYRFTRKSEASVELIPAWKFGLDEAVIRFLFRRLHPAIKVILVAP